MKNLKTFTLAGILFVSAAGTLLHFVYDWSGQNPVVGFFAPVSESTWEHLKLLFFPMLLYGLFAVPRLSAAYPFLPCAFGESILTGLLLIPLLFYTYSGILGFSVAPADIAIFYISVTAAFLLCAKKAQKAQKKQLACPLWEKRLLTVALLLFFAGFVLFSATPPDLGIFRQADAAGLLCV